MEIKTLNEIIPKLSAKQQDYLIWCVKEFSDKKDIHRGLLPFLPADVASRCLNYCLEKKREGSVADPIRLTGEGFIRNIISIVNEVAENKLYPDEDSAIIYLDDGRLLKCYKGRFSYKFNALLKQPRGTASIPSNTLVGLERVRPSYWKVTTRAKHLAGVMDVLSELFG